MSSLLLLPLPTRVGISNVLGYCSISFWLCAQIPQVMTNIRLRSCEGLALPFLVNWLFGGLSFGCLGCDASCAYCGVLILLPRLLSFTSDLILPLALFPLALLAFALLPAGTSSARSPSGSVACFLARFNAHSARFL